MADKPGAKAPPPAKKPPQGAPDVGQLVPDDRGNITWEWKDEGELLAEDTLGAAERLRALADPRLDIQEDADDSRNPLTADPKRLKKGYNPYNSGALGKQEWKKKKNLRELSKWIELRKKMAEKKDEE